MKESVLIIGGAGFIGSNTAKFYIDNNYDVTVFDNLSRNGTKENVDWLRSLKKEFKFIKGDIVSDVDILNESIMNKDIVFHFAAQVAVTTSVIDPRDDFMINALGTFNILEALRKYNREAVLLYTSTNKVYGGLEAVGTKIIDNKYQFIKMNKGISEEYPLDFHSPYGCSKGAADQYVRDYARIYGLKTIVFRQSCIYGYRQFGIEDQGWVAWFTIAALFDKQITIYGDGKQVRDVLFIDDLIKAFDLAVRNTDAYGGVYNIGGGPDLQLSLIELIDLLENNYNKKLNINYSDWRPGDQPVFVCDISKARSQLDWSPIVNVENGVNKLANWVTDNKKLFLNYFDL